MITTRDLVEVHYRASDGGMIIVIFVWRQSKDGEISFRKSSHPLLLVTAKQLFVVEELSLQKEAGSLSEGADQCTCICRAHDRLGILGQRTAFPVADLPFEDFSCR